MPDSGSRASRSCQRLLEEARPPLRFGVREREPLEPDVRGHARKWQGRGSHVDSNGCDAYAAKSLRGPGRLLTGYEECSNDRQ